MMPLVSLILQINLFPPYLAISPVSAIIYVALHKSLLSGSQFPTMRTLGKMALRIPSSSNHSQLPHHTYTITLKGASPALMPAPSTHSIFIFNRRPLDCSFQAFFPYFSPLLRCFLPLFTFSLSWQVFPGGRLWSAGASLHLLGGPGSKEQIHSSENVVINVPPPEIQLKRKALFC